MIKTTDIIGFSSLGKREKMMMKMACDHAIEVGGRYVVDGLDKLCRTAWNYGPGQMTRQLREKGYLVDLGDVLLPGSTYRVRRYQIIKDPGRVEVLKPKAERPLVLKIWFGYGRTMKELSFPVDDTFRLSMSGNGFDLEIRNEF